MCAVACGGGVTGNGSGDAPLPPEWIPKVTPPPMSLTGYFDKLPDGAYCGESTTPTLPQLYATHCAGCHGSNGLGVASFPALRNTALSQSQFVAVVLNGRGSMPAFATKLTTADAEAFWNDLTQASGGGTGGGVDERCGHRDPAVYALDAATLEEEYWKGLEAFRRPGSIDQMSCENCHTMDGIDLARIGFRDSDILRRAQMHTDLAHAQEVLRFIHVVRARYQVARLLHPRKYHFLQPGGVPLPGATIAERERALLAELRRRGIVTFIRKLNTPAEIDAAIDQLASLDMRQIPIGLELNRWTEDEAHGPGSTSMAEWIPGMGFKPNSPEYHTRVDTYLREKTADAFWAIYDRFDDLTELTKLDNSGGHLDTMMWIKHKAVHMAGYFLHHNDVALPDPLINLDQFRHANFGAMGYNRPERRLMFWHLGQFMQGKNNSTDFIFGDKIHPMDPTQPGDFAPWLTASWNTSHQMHTAALAPGLAEVRGMQGVWMQLGLQFEPHLMVTSRARGVVGGLEYLVGTMGYGQGTAPWGAQMRFHAAYGAFVNTAYKARLATVAPREALLWGSDDPGAVIGSLGRALNGFDRLLNGVLSQADYEIVNHNGQAIYRHLKETFVPFERATLDKRVTLAESLASKYPFP